MAEPEIQKQPAVDGGKYEQGVGKRSSLWPQRTQKTVHKPKNRADCAGIEKPLRRDFRRDHRIRRLSQLPLGRGCS